MVLIRLRCTYCGFAALPHTQPCVGLGLAKHAILVTALFLVLPRLVEWVLLLNTKKHTRKPPRRAVLWTFEKEVLLERQRDSILRSAARFRVAATAKARAMLDASGPVGVDIRSQDLEAVHYHDLLSCCSSHPPQGSTLD